MEQSDVDAILSTTHGLPPQHIIDARNAVSGARGVVLCGRPTKRGGTCARIRARLAPACSTHATAEEAAAADAETARLTALVEDWSASLVPACHDWPITDDDRQAVAALPVHPDDELLTARHVHDLLYDWQQGRCAVCGATTQAGALVLDHDHATALVRGWLCRSCNTEEARSDMGDFVKYRTRPPAVILGVSARYDHPWYGLVEPEGTYAEWNARALANTPLPSDETTTEGTTP